MKTLLPRKLITALAIAMAYPLLAIPAQLPHTTTSYFSAIATAPAGQSVYDWPIFSTAAVDKLTPATYATVLGWIPSQDLCGGYYQEEEELLKFPIPGDFRTQETTVTANLPSTFSQSGTSILRGNVTVTQPGRQIIADQAYLNRDPKTGKITTIDMIGNVHFREAGKLIVAQKAHVNLGKNVSLIDNAVYRFSRDITRGALTAWGTLRHGVREASGILNLSDATYSTCPPMTEVWKVRAKHLHLDREAGEGVALNTFLDIKNIPVFYLPYFRFPLDNRRKSGFLFPTYSYSVNSGFSLDIPYYLNLAPNYDATLTPVIYTKRGLQQNINFRYLTHHSSGAVNVGILPYDAAFASFKREAPAEFADIPHEDVYIRQLEKSSNTRGYFSYGDGTTFNDHWSNTLNLNYVTDDYYFQDFATTPLAITTNQLLNDDDVNYQGDHWRFLGRLQAYETLHPITQMLVNQQYQRLPQLDLTGDYPNETAGLDYHLNSEYVNFQHENDFITNNPVVTGNRLHLEPGISWPVANLNGYFIPQLQIDGTAYDLKNQVNNLPNSIDRVLPIFDIDSGLFFDRDVNLFGRSYEQTLEPRLYYLFVPAKNQSDIPNFDSTLLPFSFEQMFQTNRFTGLDRIGDANQVAFALTSRFLNGFDGQERLRASIGTMFLFQRHRVLCGDTNCLPDPTANAHISPIVGELNYTLSPVWNIVSDLAWDPNRAETNNGNINLIYTNENRIFNIGYYFVKDADIVNQVASPVSGQASPIVVQETDLSRFSIGAAWPITQHWSVLGDWNYNISGSHPQIYFYGAQYDSCCWAVRFVMGRSLLSIDQLNRSHFDNDYYVQFQLKGLGNFGYNNPGSLLMTALPGYRDAFQTGFRPMSVT